MDANLSLQSIENFDNCINALHVQLHGLCHRQWLAFTADLVAKHKITDDSKANEKATEADDVDPKDAFLQVEFFQKFDGVFKVAVWYGTVQGIPVKAINGQHDAFEAVSNVGNVGEPLHVNRNVVQRDEES